VVSTPEFRRDPALAAAARESAAVVRESVVVVSVSGCAVVLVSAAASGRGSLWPAWAGAAAVISIRIRRSRPGVRTRPPYGW